MIAVRITIFVIVSGVLFIVTVRRPSHHAPYRLLAWELLLILILMNAARWFHDPFSPHQVASWLLLAASAYFVVDGIYLLRKIGRPTDEVEGTTVLVVVGLYKYIRHPLYASLLLLGWGTYLKDPSFLAACIAVAASVALVATAKVEEAENVEKFGQHYVEYMKHTKMFLPFVL